MLKPLPATRLALALLLSVSSGFLLTGEGAAQEEVVAALEGRVLLGEGTVDTATVVLHRVSPLEAGPVDSVRVGADGSFRFALPSLPGGSGEQTVYFASARRNGILYFGDPISRPVELDSLYTIRTYETQEARSGGESFPIAVRNLFINAAEDGWHATDLFEIRNEAEWTYIAEADGPVWRYPLPSSATDPEVGQGDLPPDAVEFRDGAVEVYAPVPPGERLYILTYRLADLDFELPMPGVTQMIQVLISEPAPALDVTGLTQERPVQMEPGVQFRRYAGENLVDAVVRVAEAGDPFAVPVRELAVLLALLLTGAGIWAVLRKREGEAEPDVEAVAPERREALLLQIARLDEEFEALENPSEQRKTEYLRRRRALLDRLRRTG